MGFNGKYVKLKLPTKRIFSVTRKHLQIIYLSRVQIRGLAEQFVSILGEYMDGDKGSLQVLSKSTIARKEALGFPHPERPLYEEGTFRDAIQRIRFKTWGNITYVRTGPNASDVHHKASNKKELTYDDLGAYIIYGRSSIIPERDVFTPAVDEWKRKHYWPFLKRIIKSGGYKPRSQGRKGPRVASHVGDSF